MATVHLSNRSALQPPARELPPAQPAKRPAPGAGMLHALLQLGLWLLGVLSLLLGGALVLTLWLMPLGLPLALFGLALLASRNST